MPQYRSRVVELADPIAGAVRNARTVCLSAPRPASCDFRAVFRAHYQRIRAACLEFAEPGVAVFAFSLVDDRWRGTMCLASRPGELRAGVIGRHSSAALSLRGEDSLALRHLVVVLEPVALRDALRGDVRFRVMDLETGSPPLNEQGKPVASLTAEGPVFLVCQGYALMAFVTGDATDWPERADDAWGMLPERVFVAERAPVAWGSGPRPMPQPEPPPRRSRDDGDRVGRTTLVRTQAGPSHIAIRPLCEDEPVHGNLIIDTRARTDTLRVGLEALRRGLLVGRYERCHASAISDERVSRVHLMIVELAGRACAIDLASSNGTFQLAGDEATPMRAATLDDGQPIALAGAGTRVTWRNGAA